MIKTFDFNQNGVSVLKQLNVSELIDFLRQENSVIIVDKTVYELYLWLQEFEEHLYILESTEKHKTWETALEIIQFLDKKAISRKHKVIAIGGGVVTDLVSFVCSVYKRGVRLCLIPSTLLAMVDAALGGKTAVNMENMKNHLGTFYPAGEIILCHDFLSTLKPIERYNGLCESVKSALIRQDYDLAEKMIENSCSWEEVWNIACFKMDICTKDLYDRQERRLLNLGHSFAHVIETLTNFQITHGQAVAVGMAHAFLLSQKQNMIDCSVEERIRKLIISLLGKDPDRERRNTILLSDDFRNRLKTQAINLLFQDKKNDQQGINLILFTAQGAVEVCSINDQNTLLEILLSKECLY